MMNTNQIPRKDGRAQPRIGEPDEENMDYSDLSPLGNRGPSSSGMAEKESPLDLDHPDIADKSSPDPSSSELHYPEYQDDDSLSEEIPDRANFPRTEEAQPNRALEMEREEKDDYPIDPDRDWELDLPGPGEEGEEWERRNPAPIREEPEDEEYEEDEEDQEDQEDEEDEETETGDPNFPNSSGF
jgi:hypothetical protein